MINEVRLVGNVGNEPEIRTTSAGPMARISLATTDKWKNKKGEWEEKTQWHRLVAFGYAAEYIQKFVKKGTLLYVAGSIEYGNYEKEGVVRYTTDIKVQRARVMNGWKDSTPNTGTSHPAPPPMENDVPF